MMLFIDPDPMYFLYTISSCIFQYIARTGFIYYSMYNPIEVDYIKLHSFRPFFVAMYNPVEDGVIKLLKAMCVVVRPHKIAAGYV